MQPLLTRTLSHTFHRSSSPTHSTPLILSHGNIHRRSSGSASAKLFADAALEELAKKTGSTSSKSARLTALEQKHENWTGDESLQDAVLRMLVDKYKPLRTGTLETAEEKVKRVLPVVGPRDGGFSEDSPFSMAVSEASSSLPDPVNILQPASGSWASEPLLQSTAGHEPWHTTYKAPSHDISSVKLAQIPSQIVSSKPRVVLDDKARRMEKEQRERSQNAGRLTQARESTLDYRMGIKGGGAAATDDRGIYGQVNPVTVKGWTSLVEDRIERARQAGLFNTIKGRGQPIAQSTDEGNPFIAREEFLMNRIVQQNGAAPPWVEIQGELEAAVRTFRQVLRDSWVRRTIQIFVLANPAPILLSQVSLKDIESHRDSEWIAKEMAYHKTAIAELNSLVRKYNGVAPYIVRRSYYDRTVEVERLYTECSEDILKELKERGHAMIKGPPPSSMPSIAGSNGGSSKGSTLIKQLQGTIHRLLSIK